MSFLNRLPEDQYTRAGVAGFANPEGAFSLGAGLGAMWLAQLSYEVDQPDKVRRIARAFSLRLPADGIIDVGSSAFLPNFHTQVVIGKLNGIVVVAFAGTDPLDPADLITDLNFPRNPEGVVSGFAQAFEAVRGHVLSVLSRHFPREKAVFTGHSLGAALAVLAAQDFDARSGGVAAVFAFGMPRPGGAKFAADYNRRLGARTFRLVYGEDIVPRVPLARFGYVHVGRLLTCAQGKTFDGADLAASFESNEPVMQFSGPGLSPFPRIARPSFEFSLDDLESLARRKLFAILPPVVRDHIPDRYIEALGGGRVAL